VIAAWSVFSHTGRGSFGGALDVDDDTWDRAHGFALHQAAMIRGPDIAVGLGAASAR